MNSFKNKNAEVSDFINSVNSTLNDGFSPFFNPWLKYPQFPVLVVNEIVDNIEYGNKKKIGVTISQISDSNVYFNFKIPVVYEFNGEIKKIDVNIKDFIVELKFEDDWIIVNDSFASLCFVMYSKVLLSSLLNAKRQGKLNNLNCLLISNSVRLRSVPYLIDEEIYRITSDIYQGVYKYKIP